MKKKEQKEKAQSNGQLEKLIKRRKAEEITRIYICKINRCHKSYGSYPALYTHMKIKHKELTQEKIFELAAKEKRRVMRHYDLTEDSAQPKEISGSPKKQHKKLDSDLKRKQTRSPSTAPKPSKIQKNRSSSENLHGKTQQKRLGRPPKKKKELTKKNLLKRTKSTTAIQGVELTDNKKAKKKDYQASKVNVNNNNKNLQIREIIVPDIEIQPYLTKPPNKQHKRIGRPPKNQIQQAQTNIVDVTVADSLKKLQKLTKRQEALTTQVIPPIITTAEDIQVTKDKKLDKKKKIIVGDMPLTPQLIIEKKELNQQMIDVLIKTIEQFQIQYNKSNNPNLLSIVGGGCSGGGSGSKKKHANVKTLQDDTVIEDTLSNYPSISGNNKELLEPLKIELEQIAASKTPKNLITIENKLGYILIQIIKHIKKSFYPEFCYMCCFVKKVLDIKCIKTYKQGLENLNQIQKYIADSINFGGIYDFQFLKSWNAKDSDIIINFLHDIIENILSCLYKG